MFLTICIVVGGYCLTYIYILLTGVGTTNSLWDKNYNSYKNYLQFKLTLVDISVILFIQLSICVFHLIWDIFRDKITGCFHDLVAYLFSKTQIVFRVVQGSFAGRLNIYYYVVGVVMYIEWQPVKSIYDKIVSTFKNQ